MVVVAAAISNTIAMHCHGGGGGCYPSISMEFRWISSPTGSRRKSLSMNPIPAPPIMMPIYISTDPSHVNLQELSKLYSNCNHSCHRFPEVDPDTGGVVEAMNLDKLRIGLSHSCVTVSVFCKPQHVDVTKNKQIKNEGKQQQIKNGFVGDLMARVMPVTPDNAQLVGFGRAVSDLGLTASIYDVMVIPSLQGLGIGTIIVKKIVRMLTSKDIYDIAALCSRKERFFFKACGFRDDILGSTTMMYTRTCSTCLDCKQPVKRAGRKVLLVPPLREPFASSRDE